MILMRWMLLILTVLLLILAIVPVRNEGTHVHTFCAYNRVFVEFEENGKRWGTIMIDMHGKPIPCHEGLDLEELPVNTKEII